MSAVPCNGCTRCCERGGMVRLLPADNPADYQTEPHPLARGQLMLAHKPNGKCIYLAEKGCSIHDRKPQMCREMDCRGIARSIGIEQARILGVVHVWRKGRELILQ